MHMCVYNGNYFFLADDWGGGDFGYTASWQESQAIALFDEDLILFKVGGKKLTCEV
jgi:hypothetical protein